MSKFPINKMLDTVGDGSGTKNATGNYSGGAQSFKLIAPSGENFTISNLIVHLAGVGPFPHEGYGNIIAGLSNGWTIKIFKDGILRDLFSGSLIKSNRDLEGIATSIQHPDFDGLGNSVAITLSFNQYGMPFYIRESEYMEIALNDNFTNLDKHQFIVQGHSDKL